MTNIRQLFDEAVSTPPPSRLTANAVLAAGHARRQRITAVVASLALVAGGVVVAIGLDLRGGDAGLPPAGPTAPGPLVWAGRSDATHLYRVTNICGKNPRLDDSPMPSTSPAPLSEPVCNELWASADGGATWSSRAVMWADSLRIVGSQSLLRYRGPSSAPGFSPSASTTSETSDPALPLELSTDAGATWTALPPNGPPLDAVPHFGLIVSSTATSLMLFDPSQGRVRPLAGPSIGFLRPQASNWFGQLTALWLGGTEFPSGRATVAVAHAGEGSWTQRPLPNVASVINPSASQAGPASGPPEITRWVAHSLQIIPGPDGRTAYVTMFDIEAPHPTSHPALSGTPYLGWMRGFHTADGGNSWQEIGQGASVPGSVQGWVTADGRLVLVIEINDPVGGDARTREFVVGGPDGRFTIAAPPGLPTDLINVDGSVAYTDHAMYVSDDGWTWREAWHD